MVSKAADAQARFEFVDKWRWDVVVAVRTTAVESEGGGGFGVFHGGFVF